MKLRSAFSGVMVLLGLFLASGPVLAQAGIHQGDWYCYDCTFRHNGQTNTAETNVFIRTVVNPHVTNSWLTPNNTPKTVMVCNGTTCAMFVYAGGSWLQVGEEFPDTHDRNEYENPEDAPADPPSSGGGGGGGGGLGPLVPIGPPGCIYGCGDGKGKVDVGDVDPL